MENSFPFYSPPIFSYLPTSDISQLYLSTPVEAYVVYGAKVITNSSEACLPSALSLYSFSLISCLKELRVDIYGWSSQMLSLCFAPKEVLCLLENKNIMLASTNLNGLLSHKATSLIFA